jgi:hypothetical protein
MMVVINYEQRWNNVLRSLIDRKGSAALCSLHSSVRSTKRLTSSETTTYANNAYVWFFFKEYLRP